MITVYKLPVGLMDNTHIVAGVDIIHDAILLTTRDPGLRTLIIDTTPDEHDQLADLASLWRDPTPEELDLYNEGLEIIPPAPDTIRAEELLAQSPPAITMIEIWELLRIYARRLGYRF